jgi:hypothetical protein
MYVRNLAVKAADGFGESREGLYKSEVGKGDRHIRPCGAAEIQLGDMGESHLKNHAG